MFEGELDQMSMEFPYYLYHRNPTGWEFFVPAMTLLAVKLLTTNEAVSEVLHTELILGGPAQDLSNFQTTPIPILSVLTCSTS